MSSWAQELMSSSAHELMSSSAHELMSSWTHELRSSWAHELIMWYKQGVGSTGIMFLLPRIRPRAVLLLFNFWLLMSSWAHELMSWWAWSNQKLKSKGTARGLIRGSKNIILVDPPPCLYPMMSSWATNNWKAKELPEVLYEMLSWRARAFHCL